jgi:hypothetical protein
MPTWNVASGRGRERMEGARMMLPEPEGVGKDGPTARSKTWCRVGLNQHPTIKE